MGLLTIIKIPWHHVLANEIDLNLKYRIGLKQFFNINLRIGIIKKNYFFCLYFLHISLCFYSNFDRESSLDVVCIQWVPTLHTFDGPHYFNNKKYLNKCDDHHVFWVAGSVKSMKSGYSLDVEFNSSFNELSWSKFEEKNKEIGRKYKQKI